MVVGIELHGHRDVRHPHIFLVHRVRHPKVAVLRNTIAFLNASHILRTIALVIAAIAHRWNFALHQVQRGVFVAVGREADSQWPAVFRWIINGSIGAVGKTLAPNLGIAVDEALGTLNGLCPGQSAIGRSAGEGVFPQCGNLSVGQGVVAVGLELLV